VALPIMYVQSRDCLVFAA